MRGRQIQRSFTGWNQLTSTPASTSGARKDFDSFAEPTASSSRRTRTPSRALVTSASRSGVPVWSGSKM